MQFETTMKILQSVLVAREIYKCHFENTMMFSNYLWLVVHVNLMLSVFYFLKRRIQVPTSRNMLKYIWTNWGITSRANRTQKLIQK